MRTAPSFHAVPSAPKPRHSTQCPLHTNFVIPRAVAESISALPRHQPERPAPPALHYGYCDFAQYDGRRHFDGSCGIQRRLRPNPAISRSAVCAQTPPFHAVPSASKLRHSARSRGIHLRVAKASAREASAPALHYGYCDFAQYDGRRHSDGSCGIQRRLRPNPAIPRSALCIQTSSFRAQSRNPSPRCQGISQRGQRPLHSTMDTATSRSMTAVVIPMAVANPAPSHSTQCPLHPNFVIPRAVAESISALPRHQPERPAPLHSTMDTATSRSMTAVVISRAVAESSALCAQTPPFHAVPSAYKLRHSARSRGIHLRVAKASAREASAPCTPLWILRLRAV